jgi:CDGSH-type Zn-finger protein
MMADLKITPRKDGPLKVEGENITLVDEAGNRYDLAGRTAVSLCRCGQSQNKPFCDGSHVKVGFAAESAAFSLPPPKPKPQP